MPELLAVALPVTELVVVAPPPAPVVLEVPAVPVVAAPPVLVVAVLPPPQPGPVDQASASMKGSSAAIRGSAREDEMGKGVRGKDIG